MSVGVAIAGPRSSMQEGRWSWDSRLKKMTVSLRSKPPHLNMFELDGGSQWLAANTPNNTTRKETLFQIEHNMLYPPRVLCYFYCYDAPVAYLSLLGTYTSEMAPMVLNNPSWGYEYLYAEVDEKYFRVVHEARRQLAANTWAAYGSQFKYRFKYMITNLKHTRNGNL